MDEAAIPSPKEDKVVEEEVCKRFSGWKMSMAFLYLDNREIDDKLVRKALEDLLTTFN